MKKLLPVLACAAALAAGCASYDGRGLMPGRSTAAEIEALMGTPAERLQRGGDAIWWYPRGPLGFHSYAVRIGSDGVLRGIEQRLTVENVRRIVIDQWTRQDVHELFGPPFEVTYLSLKPREVWEYQLLQDAFRWKLWVQFSGDGIVREVLQMRHPYEDPPGGERD